jgi:hypothetical protein
MCVLSVKQNHLYISLSIWLEKRKRKNAVQKRSSKTQSYSNKRFAAHPKRTSKTQVQSYPNATFLLPSDTKSEKQKCRHVILIMSRVVSPNVFLHNPSPTLNTTAASFKARHFRCRVLLALPSHDVTTTTAAATLTCSCCECVVKYALSSQN